MWHLHDCYMLLTHCLGFARAQMSGHVCMLASDASGHVPRRLFVLDSQIMQKLQAGAGTCCIMQGVRG